MYIVRRSMQILKKTDIISIRLKCTLDYLITIYLGLFPDQLLVLSQTNFFPFRPKVDLFSLSPIFKQELIYMDMHPINIYT